MKLIFLHCNLSIKRFLLISSFFVTANLLFFQSEAQNNTWIVDSTVNLIDGAGIIYREVHPGDTVYLKAGNRNKLMIRNFEGAAGRPVVFMNKDGILNIGTNDYYGISINSCRYIRFSGQGNSNDFYGIHIKRVAAGCGIGIGAMSSDIEIDHISIENCTTEGIMAKTDPDCSFKASRGNFTQYNTSIHDNYISAVGNEGLYIGSSYYSGMHINCNAKDTLVMPPVLDDVKIYNNIVKGTGWDGIQVSSAPLHCYIFNNTITDDSQAEVPYQMSGILMGGGSACDCNNNMISNGKGDGIENHGLGGNRIFNNIIVNAGRTYLPGDPAKMKHGIFISDVSVMKDSAVCILFNDIINPKSDGIRFQSVRGRHNIIASNLIINPGNYDFYVSGNTSHTGNDAYIMIPNAGADVQESNNYFSKTISGAGISATDYTILPGSPLINRGGRDNSNISFDFRFHRRPVGGLCDVGAMEFDGGADTLLHLFNDKAWLYPNPVSSLLTIRYINAAITTAFLNIYSSSGKLVFQQLNTAVFPGEQELQVIVSKLSRGIYVYSIHCGKEIINGRFVKL